MKNCINKIKRKKRFTRSLIATRHYEIVWSVDVTLAVFYPTQRQITYVTKEFIANKLTIEEAVRKAYGFQCSPVNADFYYSGKWFDGIDQVMSKICGVKVKPDMYYRDVMKLNAKLGYLVIEHAIEAGNPANGWRSRTFMENYPEYKNNKK